MITGDPPLQGVRFCCCTGYLTNPGRRCCMDMPVSPMSRTVTTDKITIAPQPIAQGWQCPVCASILAPHVDRCPNCGPKMTCAYSTMMAASDVIEKRVPAMEME